MNNTALLKKTQLVILVTVITMIAEIYFGFVTKSMALLADGFHMGTHALALLLTAIVCYWALKFKNKEEKLNALGGYTSAILLGLTSIGIIVESINRFIHPLSISFFDAILVATIGLVVNIICVLLMGKNHSHLHNHDECHHHEHNHENLNYKAAYAHILADAFTSILAIIALILGKYFGLIFLDPVMGLIGGIVIAKWAIGLLKQSGQILLD